MRVSSTPDAIRSTAVADIENDRGFTLIELLITVVIIGILAAIAIPVYVGIQNGAHDAGAKADVSNLETALAAMRMTNGDALPPAFGPLDGAKAAPDALPVDWKLAGATIGPSTKQLRYGPSAGSYCIIATSTTGTTIYATSSGVGTASCTIGG